MVTIRISKAYGNKWFASCEENNSLQFYGNELGRLVEDLYKIFNESYCIDSILNIEFRAE